MKELHWSRNVTFERLGGMVRKVMKPFRLLSEHELQELASRIEEFYRRITRWGIATPATLYTLVELIEEKRCVVEYATDVGEDCNKILRRSPERFVEIVTGIVVGSLPLLQTDQKEVGFDSHPTNWCRDDAGRFTYVDFKPPRYYDEQSATHWVGFPQPEDPEDVRIGTWRYYSREGILRRLNFTCERYGPGKGRATILDTLDNTDPVCGRWAREYLDSLPPTRVRRDPCLFRSEVERLSPDDTDDLRELAVVAVELFDASSQLLEEVLTLSHVSYRRPRADRHAGFEKARALLLQLHS